MKKLLISLLLTLATTAAYAQVPLVASTITATTSASAPYTFVTSQPGGAYAGLNGFTSYGKNGTGDMDWIAANNGSSPSFYWYFLLGSTPTVEMYLDQNANLHIPTGGLQVNSVSATTVGTSSYTFATMPGASTVGAGHQVVVTDCTTYTVGPLSGCVGGGSDHMLALSDGTNWTVH